MEIPNQTIHNLINSYTQSKGVYMRPLNLIIFDPLKDDFLASVRDEKHMISRSWCSNPSQAKCFKKKQLALDVIRNMIVNTDRVILLAQLSDTGNQYKVVFLSQFSFVEGKLIESEVEEKYANGI